MPSALFGNFEGFCHRGCWHASVCAMCVLAKKLPIRIHTHTLPSVIHMQMSKLPGCRHKRKRQLCHLVTRHPASTHHTHTLPPAPCGDRHRRVLADFVCAGMKIGDLSVLCCCFLAITVVTPHKATVNTFYLYFLPFPCKYIH